MQIKRQFFMSFFMLLFGAVSAQAETVTLKSGTFVPLTLSQNVDSEELDAGAEVLFSVALDVTVNKKVVIKAGTLAHGSVTHIEARGMVGQGGKVTVGFQQTKSVDGQTIQLRGQRTWSGDDEVGGTVAASVILCPLFLMNKGDSGAAGEGTRVRAVVGGDYKIAL